VDDDGIQFWGQSFMVEPNGQIVHRASIDKEEVVVKPADLDKVEFARTHWPFLRDRRIDAYGPITQRFGV
jgi:N-carbamoylputrescine amidase